jgi:sialic acid synthase SpsE
MTRNEPHSVRIGDKEVGPGQPVYVIGEIGINHNGDIEIAKKLIDAAALAGCDAVKFQKRTPELCVSPAMRDMPRETPWGVITYLEYRHRVEFGADEYAVIDKYCRDKGIHWFASSWDVLSLEFMESFDPVCHKIASACLTDRELLAAHRATGRPLILSTGMSTSEEIQTAYDALAGDKLLVAHATSSYPCKAGELNLRMIPKLAADLDCPIGYSGHEVGLQATLAAVALGATFVERHITLDRSMWGSDHAASVEPWGLMRLVRDIRVISEAMGDGIKRVYESEQAARAKLRRSPDPD